MRKIIALILIAVLAFSFSESAFSEGNRKETWDKMGFELTFSEEFSNTKGVFMPNPLPAEKDGIYSMTFNYYSFSKEDSDAYNEKAKNGGLSAEDTARILEAQSTLLLVLAIDGGRDAQELMDLIGLEGSAEDVFIFVGKNDDITYYALSAPEFYSEDVKKLEPEYAEEYLVLQSALIEVLKNAEYFPPHNNSADLMGSILQFETTDLDGNTVKSEELFAAHAVTMVNIWATWCGPCKAEMPELGELARRLEAEGKDAAIIGICDDADEQLEDCRKILTERNCDYLNLLPYEEMEETLYLTTLPTTLFVNRDGVILLPPIKGLPEDLSRYEQLIDAFLGADASAAGSSAPSPVAANDAGVYRVIVTDSNGDPVKGATIQFCDDTVCMVGKTDSDGIASFPDAEEGHPYTVHILKVPEGYEKNEEEFTALETFCDVSIVLQKTA